MGIFAFRTVPVGMLRVNCYLVQPEDSGILYILDPGADSEEILDAASKFKGVRETRILLTHAHFDHIGALGAVSCALKTGPASLDPKDRIIYDSPLNCMEPYCPPVKERPVTQAARSCDDYLVLSTPGHTPGSVCYVFPALKMVFTGDTLFAGGVGRTDFFGSLTHEELIRNVREKLFTLPDDTLVYPGHEESSDIGTEKRTNPYFN